MSDCFCLVLGQSEVGHLGTWLHRVWIVHPLGDVLLGLRKDAAGDNAAASNMRQVRTDVALRLLAVVFGAIDRMAAGASGREEDLLALLRQLIRF